MRAPLILAATLLLTHCGTSSDACDFAGTQQLFAVAQPGSPANAPDRLTGTVTFASSTRAHLELGGLGSADCDPGLQDFPSGCRIDMSCHLAGDGGEGSLSAHAAYIATDTVVHSEPFGPNLTLALDAWDGGQAAYVWSMTR